MTPQAPVILWSNHVDVSASAQWDYGLLKLMFEGRVWRSRFDFRERGMSVTGMPMLPDDVPSVVVVPARHHSSAEDVEQLNVFLSNLPGVVLILIGDEEAAFPWRDVKHPNIRFWVMHPHPIKHGDLQAFAYFIGTGYRYDTPDLLSLGLERVDAPILWSFAGQITHDVRKQAANGLRKVMARAPGELRPSSGFTQGVERAEYMHLLARSRIAPAPSGPCTPDTFRLYEALEAGAFPIVDHGPEGFPATYWEMVYGPDHPLLVTNDWESVGGIIESELPKWPVNSNVTSSWWKQVKRDMVKRMEHDLLRVGQPAPDLRLVDQVTAVVTASPIAHDQYEILGETLSSIWENLGDIQVIVAFDGVRHEQRHLADDYNRFVREFIQEHQHSTTLLTYVSPRHVHQAELARQAMNLVDTDLILFMEHDTPLVTDEPIDWPNAVNMVAYGALDVLRFHHEALVQPAHEHLMIDLTTTQIMGVPLRRTTQWSQRPHLADADYYRRILLEHFTRNSNAFIEDKMHSVAQSQPRHHRIAIYHPETGNIKRSYHLDGRGSEPKFDDRQIW